MGKICIKTAYVALFTRILSSAHLSANCISLSLSLFHSLLLATLIVFALERFLRAASLFVKAGDRWRRRGGGGGGGAALTVLVAFTLAQRR